MASTQLILRRQGHDDHATYGRLFLIKDGIEEELAFTLENRPPRDPAVKEPGKSRIPAGDHKLGLRGEGGFYNRYTRRWPWHEEMVEILLDGWKWVLFHVGNYHTDTDGCVLVGRSSGKSDKDGSLAVWQSRRAYEDVYPILLEVAREGGSILIEDEQ